MQVELISDDTTEITSTAQARRELANLNLLRAVAVGLVVTSHLAETTRMRGVSNLGHLGVLLFFVHTSFVLMLSMERPGLSGCRLYAAFIVRRIFRIYPLSILTVLCVVAFQILSTSWLGPYTWPGWPRILSDIFLVQNITRGASVVCVLWSLPFEVQMYAVLPLIYLFMRRFPSFGVVWLTWFAAVMIAGAEYFARGRDFDTKYLLTRYFPCFIAGILAWLLLAERKKRLSGALWGVALALLVIRISRGQSGVFIWPRMVGRVSRGVAQRP